MMQLTTGVLRLTLFLLDPPPGVLADLHHDRNT